MSLYSNFGTDPKLEQQGLRVEYATENPERPIVFILARAGGANKEFSRVLEQLLRPHRQALRAKVVSKELEKAVELIYMQVFARTVVKGWENVDDENGKSLPFTPDNALKVMTDLPQLYAALKSEAEDWTNYKLKELEDDAGNSGQSSVTSGNMA